MMKSALLDKEKRPLVYGEIEDACTILEENAGHIKHAIPGEYLRYNDESTGTLNRENLSTELQNVGKDPEGVFDFHTRPQRPSASEALMGIEKRSSFRSKGLFADPDTDVEELERTDFYLDAHEIGRYDYAHGTYKGRIALKHVQNDRRDGENRLYVGIVEMINLDNRKQESELGFYPFREVHGTDHVWAFLHDFEKYSAYYGDTDSRFTEVWSKALVAIENDLF